ncbi:hypothetical protein ADIARSV_1408 [Arcticibacter svalbardensis MN12-7]|uniref:Lipoprotein n=1 Tax=Arcticibacter svalbardensis MN12-7 TaxID=1150600 RepID=R9GU70_9SPHI|nr:hypothetical protein ADIARSV_1408 [Arcticibacter svalbardensis MN12-7]
MKHNRFFLSLLFLCCFFIISCINHFKVPSGLRKLSKSEILEEPESVDKRRAEMGLIPLKEYLKNIQ